MEILIRFVFGHLWDVENTNHTHRIKSQPRGIAEEEIRTKSRIKNEMKYL